MANSPTARIDANLAAIRLAQTLLTDNRWATPDEQAVLAGYTGWGGAAQIFDGSRTDMAGAREELRGLLEDQHLYNQLALSTTDAYYTAPEVTTAITQTLTEAGVTPGNVLEPGSGTGNFISSLKDMGQVTGIEVDPISAYISSQLYPDATVAVGSFADHDTIAPVFDAAIGNVPFGDTAISVNSTNPEGFLPHNHFINHSLSLLNPGGYAAFVTSTGTSDSASDKARRAMIDKADLIAAVRLPRQTFRAIAGTDTLTDVLVFRARKEGEHPTEQSLNWLESNIVTIDGSPVRLNNLFVDHEYRFIGKTSVTTNQYGAPQLTVNGSLDTLGGDLTASLSAQIAEQQYDGLTYSPDPNTHETAYQAFLAPQDQAPMPGEIRYQHNADGTVDFSQYNHATLEWDPVKPQRKSMANEWVTLLDLRDATLTLREAYTERDDTAISAAQSRLESLYDSYVERYGPINRFDTVEKKPTKKALAEARTEVEAQYRATHGLDPHEPLDEATDRELDELATEQATKPTKVQPHLRRLESTPHFAQVLALEHFDESTGKASKAQIFSSDPARQPIALQPTDDITDAFHAVRAARGDIRIEEIAELTGLTPDQAVNELLEKGIVFRNPDEPEAVIAARDYLSGNVREKLAEARLRASDDERFSTNVTALEEVQPTWVEDVTVRPGATWINPDYYRDYLVERLGAPSRTQVHFSGDKWDVEVPTEYWDWGGEADFEFGLIAANNAYNTRFNYQASGEAAGAKNQGVACNRNDGVAVPAFRTFQSVLNLTAPKGRWSKSWREDHGVEEENSQATTFLKRKAEALTDDFQNWLMSSPQRRDEILEAYNATYNSYVAPSYDGSHLQLPGLGEMFSPYDYQRDAVQRIVSEPGVLLNHVVGAGKTGSMLMGAAELRRLGLAKQPWMVVPNHIAAQITREAVQWYPSANVLSAAGIDNATDRERFIAQTTAGDWDLVVVPQSVFERIPMGKDATIDYLSAKIEEMNAAVEEAKANGADAKSPTVKNLQSAVKSLIKKVEQTQSRADTALTFEQTPCDYLFVDEAHHYKNMLRASQVDDLNNAGSQRSLDMEMKLDRLRADKATEETPLPPVVTFATGTPIANNLAEIWVMMKYLRPDLAAELNMSSVLGFGAAFTKQTTDVEVNASGTGLRQKTRTAEYVNVGELATATSLYMDVVTRDQVAANATRPLPVLSSGDSNTVVEFDAGVDVKDFIADFDYRSGYDWRTDPASRRMSKDQITVVDENGRPVVPEAPQIDNPLTIANDGKKVSLDPRLVNLDVDGPGPRIAALTNQVFDVWQHSKDNTYTTRDGDISPNKGGLQIIFCDQGTPGGAGYNLYADIRSELTKLGMDPQRIQFIHDWKDNPADLYQMCNAGEVDVIIGSTPKMGTGANIQTRAVALHHLDVPWKPADLEQREGRIIRQGNQNSEVNIYNYLAAGTFDAVMWQTLYRKQKFINQFYAADRDLRQMDSLDESAADAAAMNKAIATGDHRYVELFQLSKQITELTQTKREWQATRNSRTHALAVTRSALSSLESTANSIEPLIDKAEKFTNQTVEERQRSYGRRVFADRAAAANHLVETCASIANNKVENPQTVISLGGIEFQARYRFGEIEVGIADTMGTREVRFSRAGLGEALSRDPDSATTKAYGMLTQLENKVKELPSVWQKATLEQEKNRIKLDRLEAEDVTTFTRQDELTNLQQAYDALQVDLENESQSPEAQQRRAERAERMRVKGREPGWSQEFSPTQGYAVAVHGTTDRQEVINGAKINQARSMFEAGAINEAELTAKIAAARPDLLNLDQPGITSATKQTPETMSPAERLALQAERSKQNTTTAESNALPHEKEASQPQEL